MTRKLSSYTCIPNIPEKKSLQVLTLKDSGQNIERTF